MYVTTNLEDLPLVKLNFEDGSTVIGIKNYITYIYISGTWFNIGVNNQYKYPYNKMMSLKQLIDTLGLSGDVFINQYLGNFSNTYFNLYKTTTININPVKCKSVSEFISILITNIRKRKEYKNNLKSIDSDLMVGVAFKSKHRYSKFQQIGLSSIFYRKSKDEDLIFYHVVNGKIECILDRIDKYMFIESEIPIDIYDKNRLEKEIKEVGDKQLELPTINIYLTPINNSNELVKNNNLYIARDPISNVNYLLHKIKHEIDSHIFETLAVDKEGIKPKYKEVYYPKTGKKVKKPEILKLTREDRKFNNITHIGNIRDIHEYLNMVRKD